MLSTEREYQQADLGVFIKLQPALFRRGAYANPTVDLQCEPHQPQRATSHQGLLVSFIPTQEPRVGFGLQNAGLCKRFSPAFPDASIQTWVVLYYTHPCISGRHHPDIGGTVLHPPLFAMIGLDPTLDVPYDPRA